MSSETGIYRDDDRAVDRVASTVSSRNSFRSGALCWLIATAFAYPASAQHLDVMFQENQSDGRLSVHGRNFGVVWSSPNRVKVGQRIYGRFFDVSGNTFFKEDPGFTAAGNPLEVNPFGLEPPPPSTPVYFNVLAAPPTMPELGGRTLSWWDGDNVGGVSWGPVPGVEAIEIRSSPQVSIDVDGGTTDIPGFLLGATSSTGELHEHIDFVLSPGGFSAAKGVYLMLLEATLGFKEPGDENPYAVPEPDSEPYAEWVPFFVYFDKQAVRSDAIEATKLYIEANFDLPLCSDGIDNDRDGLIDAPQDPGCEDGDDMSERGAANECDNGVDDEIPPDGFTDYPNDPDCLDAFGVTELPEPGTTAALLAGGALVAALGRRRRRV